jgi:hypothetical protein
MTTASTDEKKEALLELQASILSHADWWLFPTEPSVQGFLGTGKIFIVGDQPSTDHWETAHPHRRAFYDLLATEGAGDCHLTDLYKRRGVAGELRNGIPEDFDEHRRIFRTEIELLRSSAVLALGWDAYNLLSTHTPELSNILKRVLHFGVVRHGKLAQFQASLRSAIIAARQGQR